MFVVSAEPSDINGIPSKEKLIGYFFCTDSIIMFLNIFDFKRTMFRYKICIT